MNNARKEPHMQNRRDCTLYNVIFPIWLLWLFPAAWLVVLPANLLIDLLVVVLTLRALHVQDVKLQTKSVLLRVWLMGFAADFIGTALMFLAGMLDFGDAPFGKWWYDNVSSPIAFNPFASVYAFLWTTLCVAVTGLCIYWFNRKFCLKKAALEEWQKHKLALSLAIFTAPYLFYLPTRWFY